MTKEMYFRIERFFRRRRPLYKCLIFLNKFLTMLLYAIYPIFLIVGIFAFRGKLLDVISAPLFSFVAATFFRRLFNARRPYEVYRTSPLIRKNTPGQSFPSRHVACAVAIAYAVYYVLPAFGVILFAIAALIAIIRVLGGVHFISDVLFGALISMNIAMLMYVIF